MSRIEEAIRSVLLKEIEIEIELPINDSEAETFKILAFVNEDVDEVIRLVIQLNRREREITH
jgi:hypothetical protein